MFIDPEVVPGRPPLGGPCFLDHLILRSKSDSPEFINRPGVDKNMALLTEGGRRT
jgi:hypothetical protein